MAKNAQLVSQHLENISSDTLEKYQDVIRNYVRRQGIDSYGTSAGSDQRKLLIPQCNVD